MDEEIRRIETGMAVVVDSEFLGEAEATLTKYKEGKQSIDQKATENQEWWKMRHWPYMNKNGDKLREEEKPTSAWLFNSIINKVADIMDNFPKLNVLPREQGDEQEAEILSKIIPVIHERNREESIYRQAAHDLMIEGGATTGVFWDASANDGMGEIVKRNIDVHNLFWEPGITNIQDSRAVFHVQMEDVDVLKATYPDKAEQIAAGDPGTTTKYLHDDNIDTSNMCEVVDMYYKVTTMVPTAVDESDGSFLMAPKKILHYVKYVGDTVLYASEDDPAYKDDGFYDHGKYPFVIRSMFAVKDSPWGFGFVDVMKSPQKYIDSLDHAILRNAQMKAEPRWFVRDSANIDLEQFANWAKTFIPVSGSADLNNSLRQVEIDTVPASVSTHMLNKIEELKETSANRDFSQGSTASGVTAASAIAALQEAGGKIARHINKIMYEGSREEGLLEVELIRQFYTEPRSFRIDQNGGGYSFETYISPQVEQKHKAIFDINISAEKQSPFSRAAQNETAKEMYNLGFFNPQMAEQALACLDMMEFEGKDKICENIQNNSAMMMQMQKWQQLLMELDQMLPELGIGLLAGLVDPQQVQQAQPNVSSGGDGHTPEEIAMRKESDTTRTANARIRAANQGAI